MAAVKWVSGENLSVRFSERLEFMSLVNDSGFRFRGYFFSFFKLNFTDTPVDSGFLSVGGRYIYRRSTDST